MSQTFASALRPVEIPHPDHHSVSGSATTTPTFSPANKPTPLVGSWADYGWDKGNVEPNSATVPDLDATFKPKGSTPLLPSTVSAFDDRRSPLASNATETEAYISNLLHETAKLTEDGDDVPAPAPRANTPPPSAPAAAQPEFRSSTYGRAAPQQRPPVNPVPPQYQVTQFTQQAPIFFPQPNFIPQQAAMLYAADPKFATYARGGAQFTPAPRFQPAAQPYEGHVMPVVHQTPHNAAINITKFTPPPPPNIAFANELAGADSETPPARVGDVLFAQGRRWTQKVELWLAAHPRERPSAPCPAPDQYTTIEAWLEKIGNWYEANFNGRKVAGGGRGGANRARGGRGGRGGRGASFGVEASGEEATRAPSQ